MPSPSSPPGRSSWRTVFEISTTVLMLAAAGALLWQNRTPANTPAPSAPPVLPSVPIAIGQAPTKGALTAKVAIVEFSEFQCPFCGKVARETMPALEKAYIETGRVRLVFKSFPLARHSLAPGAARAALCAGNGGKFWQMHDLLFSNQDTLQSDSLTAFGNQLGLDMNTYHECLGGDAAAARVRADKTEGDALGVTATPTFFFGTVAANGVHVSAALKGAVPIGKFSEILDRLLASNAP